MGQRLQAQRDVCLIFWRDRSTERPRAELRKRAQEHLTTSSSPAIVPKEEVGDQDSCSVNSLRPGGFPRNYVELEKKNLPLLP